MVVISAGNTVAEAEGAGAFSPRREHEQCAARALGCPPAAAAMVAKLMVVLSGDHSPTRVINTGSLYG
jgi:hypothetical protein